MVVFSEKFAEKKRSSPLLFVFSPSRENRFYQMQMEQLESIQLALDDCRLRIAEIFEEGHGHIGTSELGLESCGHFRERFHIQPGQFKILLMSPDSEIHLISEDCISWQELMLRIEDVSRFHVPAM